MLNIYFGEMEECVYNTSMYFDNTYEDNWITSDLAKDIIKDIDKSTVLSAECIQSEVLGQIPPTQLSGGTKTLLLIYNEPTEIFNASTCGDNCNKWILKMAEEKDITINVRHFMNFGKNNFNIKVLNNNKIVHNMKELLPLASKFLRDDGEAVNK